MNIQNFFENIIAGLICTALCAIIKRFYLHIKAETSPAKTPSPGKILRRQFFGSLFTLVLALPAAFMISASTSSSSLSLARIFLFIIAGFAFLFVWGTFDSAFAFYPKDDSRDDEPADQPTNHTTQD